MNEIPLPPPASLAVATQFDEQMRMAEFIAKSSLLPDHLRGKPSDVLMVLMQAQRWGMDAFSVAQCTSIVRGRLMYEGKLVHAALLASGVLACPFDYEYAGSGDSRSCTIVGTLASGKVCRHTVVWKLVAVAANAIWRAEPDKMLAYRGSRDWARLYAPHVMLGVMTADEAEPAERDVTPPPGSAREKLPELRAKLAARRAAQEGQEAEPPPAATPTHTEVSAPADDRLFLDFLAAVSEASDAAEMTRMVEQSRSFDGAQKEAVQSAITKRAKSLGLKWSAAEGCFSGTILEKNP